MTITSIESSGPEFPATRRYVETGGANLFTIERGSGSPTIILLHGVTANAFVWEPVMNILANEFRVVSVDQRGHGRTGAVADGAYDASSYAQDVIDLVVELKPGPVIVVGHSLGARNAIQAAAMSPQTVAGVVAIDFTPFIEGAVFDALHERVSNGSRGFANLDEVRRYLRGRYELLPDDAIERRALYGYASLRTDLVRPLADTEAVVRTCVGLRADLSRALESVEVPVVLVRGSKSKLVSKQAFAAACQLRPDLKAVEIEGTDHYVPEEKPTEVAEIVVDLAKALRGTSDSERARN